jgi:hypothetical protein
MASRAHLRDTHSETWLPLCQLYPKVLVYSRDRRNVYLSRGMIVLISNRLARIQPSSHPFRIANMGNDETHSHSEHGVHVCYYKSDQSVELMRDHPRHVDTLTLAQNYARSTSQVPPDLTVLHKILRSHISYANRYIPRSERANAQGLPEPGR